jgi:hypothetical protein
MQRIKIRDKPPFIVLRTSTLKPTGGRDYLKDVLTRPPRMTNQDDLAPLLPSRW